MGLDLTKFAVDLFVGAIGGLVGGTVGAFLKGKWELKGQHIATYENIEFLLAQERGKAYEQERGKRLATHEDIENVLKEIDLVTQKTETIKAQIGTEAWTRQMLWHQKRGAYSNILKCINAHFESLQNLHAYREGVWRGAKRLGLDLSAIAPEPNQIEDRMIAYVNSHRDLSNALTEAYVFVDQMSHPLLNGCLHNTYFGSAFGRLDQRANLDRTEHEKQELQEKGTQEFNMLGTWVYNFIASARRDLGVDP